MHSAPTLAGNLFLDVETASLVDLPACGSDIYFDHPSTRVILFDALTDDGEVISWTEGEPVPERFIELLLLGYQVVAHGQVFERLAFERVLCPRHGFPMPPNWGCSMMRARYNGLPAALQHAASSLGLPVEKDMAGSRLMKLMCRPRGYLDDGTPRWWHIEDPSKLKQLHEYCFQDSRVSQAVWRFTRTPTDRDLEVYDCIARMNKRGVCIDTEFALAAADMAQRACDNINRRMRELTGGRVDAATKVKQLREWIALFGIDLDSLDKREMAVFLNTPGASIPDPVREAIKLRLDLSKASVAKFKAMNNRANRDGRVQDLHVWHGASTGRLSSQGLQVQNFRREIHPDALRLIELIKVGAIEPIQMQYGEVMELLSTLLRPALIARPGRELVGGDLSQIEARVTAWLADDQVMLNVFRSNKDLYRVTASGMFNVGYDDVTPVQRQAGKVSDLALGFGGSTGALHSMGRNYGLTFTDSHAELLVTRWRETHPKHRPMWKAFERAALAAVMNPGKPWRVAGPVDIDYAVDPSTKHLHCRLPSGRLLTYRDVELTTRTMPWGEVPQIVASGVNSVTRRFERYDLTRVILVENGVQAISADVMFNGMLAADEAGFEPVLSVHDELACEPPPDRLEACKTQLKWMMTQPLPWAPGLPLDAKIWHGPRYMKE